MESTFSCMTFLALSLMLLWIPFSVSSAATAAAAVQPTMTYPCSVCRCSITVLQRGQSIAADCSNLLLTETPFDLPRKIGTLDMSKNEVNSSHLLHLYRYPNLRHLNASFNAFTDFDVNFDISKDQFLTRNFQILTLDLSGNLLRSIDNHAFANMPYIREIIGLEARVFPPDSLNQLTDLQKISVTSHQTVIPEKLFHNLRVSYLKLNVTEAFYLPERIFRHPHRSLLSNLSIIGENIKELHVDTLRSLVLLKHIEIVGPKMRLPAHLFHDDVHGPNSNEEMPVNLKTIRISGVRSLPSTIFHKQKSLEHLELHGVEDLPFGLFESVTMDSLDLSGCDIYELQSESFQGLSSLRVLNLSDTHLTSIKVSAFTGLQSLTSLDLSNNFIDNIAPALFDKLRRTLVTLVISNNSLNALDKNAFRNMMSLEKLDLSKNNISSLPLSLLGDLGKLAELNLKENQLHNIPPNVLEAQVNMENLDLGTNLLNGLPSNVFDTTRSLRRVDLSANNITFLPKDIFKTTRFLETVKLTGNPIHCGCDILFLPQNIIGLELHGYCSSPKEYAYMQIQDVQIGDMCISTSTLPTTLPRGISISPTPVVTVSDEPEVSSQLVDSLGSTGWMVSSYVGIQPSTTLSDTNMSAPYNDSFRADVGMAHDVGHVFGSFGLDGFYIAMGVVAAVSIFGSIAMAIYRKRQTSRSMVYIVNPEGSNDQTSDDVVGSFARVGPGSFDGVGND
ncbi:leucine-rich repeat-containing protein 15-like [Ylistrum balloti]|uniref:leucine-rich repeat-containing protein 15-like n=1 Tax=Ylistrum balloti TaxID=509963 RepID=UPI002905CE74|nr:leucine-rich repeat-containing protein 15-like [Ylistrum balloti]